MSRMIGNRTYGPSPWYIRGRSFRAGNRRFVWTDAGAGEEEAVAGAMELRDAAQCVVMVVPMYAYLHPLSGGRLLVWQPGPNRGGASGHMAFAVIDVEKLTAPVSLLDVFRIPVDLADGVHHIEVPDWLRVDHELLILVTRDAPRARTVWRIAPMGKELEVIPQDWFNDGDFDFGYEWITRIGRDSKNRLVGDGIRIGPFRLDESGRNLDCWLDETAVPE